MNEIDPFHYGRLTEQVESLRSDVSALRIEVQQLVALAERGKGVMWIMVTMAAGVGALAQWLSGLFKPH